MRMDSAQELTAATVVNEYSEERLAELIADYGEERFARRIAERIVATRPLHTTADLVTAVKSRDPGAGRRRGAAPGTPHLPGDPHGGQPRAAEPRDRGSTSPCISSRRVAASSCSRTTRSRTAS